MKNNKGKKVFVISIIIVIVLILILGVAYAMFATNIFKSDKDLFFEYIAQIFDDEKGFKDNKIEQYNDKKQSSIYEHEGKISANITSSNLSQTKLDEIKNFSISFAGNIDNPNNKVEELVKLNYSNDVNFPILYKNINGTHGIKLSDISKRFFTIKEDDFSKLIGIDNSTLGISFSDAIDESMLELTSEEKDRLTNDYLAVIKDNLEESSFSKISATDEEGYSLELSNEKFKEILIKLFETLKDDEIILNKINTAFNLQMTSDSIDLLINSIDQTEIPEGNSIITVYQSDNKLNKIEIQYNDEFKITISKSSSDDEVKYDITLESQSYSINIALNYSGLQNLEQITEDYLININMGTTGASYSYNISNAINFTNSDIEIEDFKDDEYIDLGTVDQEKLGKLFDTIGKGIEKANTEKMQEAGIQGENPLIAMIPGLSEGIALYNSMSNAISNTAENQEQSGEIQDNQDDTDDADDTSSNATDETTDNTTENTIDSSNTTTTTDENSTNSSSSLVDGMEQVSKESFNEKFKQYEGNNVKGATVKSLLMQVIANNMIDDGRKIEVTGDINLTGNEVPDSVESSKTYKVKCSTDIEGYVNKVEIKENI